MFDFQSKNSIILFKSFVLGGAEKQGLYLANYLQNKKGCNVYIYSYIKSPNSKLFYQECKKYQLRNLYIEKNPLSASGQFKYLKRRIKIALFGLKLRKHKPDIIIPYLNPPSIIASLCYKIAGAKFTFWHHRGADYFRGDHLEYKAVISCPYFISNSHEGKLEIINKFMITKPVYVIPNFSTISKINKKDDKNCFSIPKGRVIIGMIAHFVKHKQQILLIESFALIVNRGFNVHLALATSKYDSDDFKKRNEDILNSIESSNLSDRVTIFYDKLSQDILPILNIGVLISNKEGMPNVILEYMAYKRPIVCTKHLGCEVLLGDNYPYFVDSKSDDISSKLISLLNEKEEGISIGNINNLRLKNQFNIESYLDQLTKILV